MSYVNYQVIFVHSPSSPGAFQTSVSLSCLQLHLGIHPLRYSMKMGSARSHVMSASTLLVEGRFQNCATLFGISQQSIILF